MGLNMIEHLRTFNHVLNVRTNKQVDHISSSLTYVRSGCISHTKFQHCFSYPEKIHSPSYRI